MSAPSTYLDDALPEYVLGTLSPAEERAIARLLAASPELRQRTDSLSEALALAMTAGLSPVAPSPGLRPRLLATVAGAERFAPFYAGLGKMLDLPREAIAALLAKVNDAAAYVTGYAPGLRYFNFTPGPQLRGADAGIVRLAVGATFPRHRHVDLETTFILEGQMREGDEVHGPGTCFARAKESEHGFSTEGPRDLVLVSVHRGLVPV